MILFKRVENISHLDKTKIANANKRLKLFFIEFLTDNSHVLSRLNLALAVYKTM